MRPRRCKSDTAWFFSSRSVAAAHTQPAYFVPLLFFREAWLSVEQFAVVSAVVLSALVMVATSNFGGPDRESLTLQEWWWALRGNYFPTMVVHFLKYGGL